MSLNGGRRRGRPSPWSTGVCYFPAKFNSYVSCHRVSLWKSKFQNHLAETVLEAIFKEEFPPFWAGQKM